MAPASSELLYWFGSAASELSEGAPDPISVPAGTIIEDTITKEILMWMILNEQEYNKY